MAHQLRPDVTRFRAGPKILLDRPRMASLLGVVVSAWSTLEEQMAMLYGHLLGLRLPIPVPPGYKPPNDPLGRQIFDVLETLRHRLELLEAIAKWTFDRHPALLKRLQGEVFPAIRNAAKLRNAIVHGVWQIADEYPDALILDHRLVYEESDFNEAVDR